jgi:heme a synthase
MQEVEVSGISGAATAPAVLSGERRFARCAWGVLAFNLVVVLWGGFVRASGSGAGCGSHWPLCNGEVVPQSPATATVIEFVHRLMSALDLLLVGGLCLWARRLFPRKHSVRKSSVLSAVFLLGEALIGAGLVLFEHVAKDASIARAYWLAGHLLNTLTLLACLALTAWWAATKALPTRLAPGLVWIAGLSLGGVMLLSVSGAIAALGDTLFPATTLVAGLRDDLSSVSIFVRLRLWHPVIAGMVVAGLLFAVVPVAARGGAVTRRIGVILGAFVTTQLLAGFVNVLLLAPVWAQMVHLLLADLMWIALVLFFACALAH